MDDSANTLDEPTLLVGFDSAWTAHHQGAIVGLVRTGDGALEALGTPQAADFAEAAAVINGWQRRHRVGETIILLDQPTIVCNAKGQRPVENIVASPVSRRGGGMQPANVSRTEMFGPTAPVWDFLDRFGGAADTSCIRLRSMVLETYPVLAIIALRWLRPGKRELGRLPKYNPARAKTFLLDDWQYLCAQVAAAYATLGLPELADWARGLEALERPRKADQDRLDACLCLLAAIHLATAKECLMIGDRRSGFIVVPHSEILCRELEERCRSTNRDPKRWLKTFALGGRARTRLTSAASAAG